MMSSLKSLAIAVILLQLGATDRAVPPQHTDVKLTCADYKYWYEQDRRHKYDNSRDSDYRFSDLHVTSYPDRKVLSADELMQLLDAHRKDLGIDAISLSKVRNVHFELDDLMYPQNFEGYTLSKDEWRELQRRARADLQQSPYAHPDVIAHWQSIADGHPPFGLKVRP